ncbi:NUMOD1 domain-containing DNA-binding protein [Algibacter sp. L4_22]|uniref:NUMOD1 domain-containing DNA-binding protein n=1 Tax=Algibacter sp. L4_22 TaxID=2942477 RepID=UPI00201B86BE|nr:NUMOD1 domain-containing DNA-binding protein [Algibacter sp. L4_22]MCL5127128.1 NUMOD1 domain-containing DNA-binding protein [Algibacter sp. L4_22]
MKKKKVIYKVTNEFDNSVYVGVTTCSLHQRKLDHLERAGRGESSKFHDAIGTYGSEAFKWEQIDTASTIDELAKKEKEYIKKLNSKEQGYNADAGGGIKKTVYQYSIKDGSLVDNYDSLESAANAVSAYKTSVGNACLGQNKTCKDYYWSYNYSEPFSPEKDLRKKQVVQYSLSGEQLTIYESVAEASRQTGVSKTCIARVCRGERKSSRGFKWSYK